MPRGRLPVPCSNDINNEHDEDYDNHPYHHHHHYHHHHYHYHHNSNVNNLQYHTTTDSNLDDSETDLHNCEPNNCNHLDVWYHTNPFNSPHRHTLDYSHDNQNYDGDNEANNDHDDKEDHNNNQEEDIHDNKEALDDHNKEDHYQNLS
jgi:son of sevenless-like protein